MSQQKNSNNMKKIATLIAGFSSLALYGQDAAVAPEAEHVKNLADKIHDMDSGLLVVLVAGIMMMIVMLLSTWVVIHAIINILNAENRAKGRPEISLFGDLKKKFITGDLLPVERSEEIQLSHNYDGIVELDNTMPPWLRAIFGVTILFAISYLGYYYVLGIGKFQTQEYKEEMEQASIEIAEYQKKAANAINEENVKQETDKVELAAAKEIFAKNCKTCHGANAEGGAGPNLTDAYWLHGGSVQEIFKTIKYGVPAKGMIAWQQKLTPKDIQSLTGYILSVQGTNPAGAKAPQGELVSASSDAPNDSTTTSVPADSTGQAGDSLK